MSTGLLDKKLTDDEGVDQYLQALQQYPRLTPEEEKALAVRCAAGDEDAIRLLVNSNMWFVVHMAKKYKDLGIPLMDLIQEGSIGLICAARKFDHTMGYRLSTYAGNWIRGAICRYLREHEGELQLSAYNLDELTEQIEDMDTPQPHDALVRQELEKQMGMLLRKLTKRQQQVLRLRFGMEDGLCHTQESVGQTLNISRQRVRQIEIEAMDKLQKLGMESGLEDFLV